MLHVNRTSACLVFALLLTSFSLSARADTVVVTADHMLDVIAGKVIDKPQVMVTDPAAW